MASTPDNPFLALRSVIETPVLDERKWAKLASIPCDAVLCDMEDAVPRTRKLEGRAAVIAALGETDFGHRMPWTRPNGLDTEWGVDDTIALARAGVEHMMMPKIDSAADVAAYRDILNDHGVDPDLIACIESPAAVANVEEIAAADRVVAFAFGEGDLTAGLGIQIFEPDGSVNPILTPARSRTYMAAAAHHVARFETVFLHDLKDLGEFRARAEYMARTGATGMVGLYPPHIEVINEIFSPSPEEVARARQVVEVFDGAITRGDPAIQLPNGRAVLIHDYLKAQQVLARAGTEPPEA